MSIRSKTAVKFNYIYGCLLVLIVLPRISKLRNWKVGNFNCVFLGTLILEMRTSKKFPQYCGLNYYYRPMQYLLDRQRTETYQNSPQSYINKQTLHYYQKTLPCDRIWVFLLLSNSQVIKLCCLCNGSGKVLFF